jgi:hypothetical protein
MLTKDQQDALDSMKAGGCDEEYINARRELYEEDNARTPEERERHRMAIEYVMPRYMSECPAGYVEVEPTVEYYPAPWEKDKKPRWIKKPE